MNKDTASVFHDALVIEDAQVDVDKVTAVLPGNTLFLSKFTFYSYQW